MSTSSDIISLFKTEWESYSPIAGPPTDDNMVHLCEAIITILYSIYLGANAGCPPGLILTDAAYKCSLATNVGFDSMSGAFKSYNPDISDDATGGVRKKREREGAATLATQQLIRACEHSYRSFILNVVGTLGSVASVTPTAFTPTFLPDISSIFSQLTLEVSSAPALSLCLQLCICSGQTTLEYRSSSTDSMTTKKMPLGPPYPSQTTGW